MKVSTAELDRHMHVVSDMSDWKIEKHTSLEPADSEKSMEVYWVGMGWAEGNVSRHLTVYMGVSGNCLVFQIPIVLQVFPGSDRALQYFLLQLNSQVRIVKFGLDAFNQLYLLCECLLRNIDHRVILEHLDGLRSVFASHFREIETLSSDPRLMEEWSSLMFDEANVEILQTTKF